MLMIIEVWIMPIIFIFAPEVSHPDFSESGGVFVRSKRRESWIVLGLPVRIGLFPTPSIHGFSWLINKYLLIGMIIQVGIMVIGSVS